MKLRRNKTTCYLKKRVVNKGDDGEKYVTYSDDAVEFAATVYSKSGQMQGEQAGYTQQYQRKLLCDDAYTVSSVDGVETYSFNDGAYTMTAGDGICLYATKEQEPDYRILAIYPVGHLKILLEKL